MRALRDAPTVVLAVGMVAGIALAFVVPTLRGIDEPGHFFRAYQMSSGRLIPQGPPGGGDGGGACVPASLVSDYGALAYTWLAPKALRGPAAESRARRAQIASTPPCDPHGRKHFVDFSTFAWYSPLPYAPAALAVGAGRALGVGIESLDRLARLAGLAVSLAIAYAAVRRAPAARWAFAAVALLPITLLQAATLTPDGITDAVALFVTASTLRALAGDASTSRRRMLVEAIACAVVLALCKPTYAVLALAYLVPLLARERERVRRALVMLAPVAAAFLVSLVWQRVTRHLFVCDVHYFGIHPDPGGQVSDLLQRPWRLASEIARSLRHFGFEYVKQSVVLYERFVGDVPAVAWLPVLIGFCAIGAQHEGGDRLELIPKIRVSYGVIGVGGVLAVYAGFYVYCSAVGHLFSEFTGPRHFVPLLAAFAVALGPPRALRTRFGASPVPLAAALVPFYAVFVAAIAVHTT